MKADGLWANNFSVLFETQTKMLAGAQVDTPEVVSRYLNILCDTYSDTTNVEYALSCTRPGKKS